GIITYDLGYDAACLEGSFGILPAAHETGHTDGVEFVVQYLPEDGQRVVLWRRFLDPARMPQDRGIQPLRIDLSSCTSGGRLELVTTDLPGHNGDCDWSFWTGLRILDNRGRLQQ